MITVSGDKGTMFFDIQLDITVEQWNDLSQGEQQEIIGLEECNVWGVTEA